MTGITAYGFYIPRFRLERAEIARAWGGRQPAGSIAVANYDEDALTLGAEAAADCLGRFGCHPDSLLFASTTSPYAEKQVASYIATVCDLPRRLWTADFCGSVRGGLTALMAAGHAVSSGARREVMVTAADMRLGEPQGELEGWFGDAAAAVCIGTQGVLAELVDQESVAEEFTHFWRLDQGRFVQAFSGKFSNTYGYVRDLGEAVGALLERRALKPGDISYLAVASPDGRASADLAKALGFEPKRQLRNPPHPSIGSAGVADPLLALIAVLEEAKPGELIVAGGYGEGADAVLIRVTADGSGRGMSLKRHLDGGTRLPSYEKYLKYRRIVPTEETGEAINNVLEYKELKQDVRLYGSRCGSCGTVQYPIARVCIKCRARDGLTAHRLSRRGQVFTFTVDHLIANAEHPLPMVVLDLEGGGRLYLQATDAEDAEVQVGQQMMLTFRHLHEGGGNHNYYWKARPER